MRHNFETFPEKMYRLFGEKTFRPGSFKFKFINEMYDIVRVCEGKVYYGDVGYYLKSDDSTQFIITALHYVRTRICDPIVIHIEERDRYLKRFKP